jgi:hypothetical protein
LVYLSEDPRREDAGLKKPFDAKGLGRFIGTYGSLKP